MIAVGRIGRVFGNEGGVMVTLYANFPDDFQTKEPLFVVIDKLAVPLFCTSLERRGQAGAIIHFDDIDTVRRAEEYLVGRELLIEEGEDDNDEFYMEDLRQPWQPTIRDCARWQGVSHTCGRGVYRRYRLR